MLKNILFVLALFFIFILNAVNADVEKNKLGRFLGAKNAETPSWFKQSFLDIKEDLSEAKDNNRFVIVYFHQNGCPYCEKLINENFHHQPLVSKLKKNFDIIEINMWGDRDITDWSGRELNEKEFTQLMQVQFTPSLLFLDSTGEMILRLNGYQSIAKMNVVLDYITSRSYQNISFAHYKNNLTNPSSLKLIKLKQAHYFDNAPFILSRSKQFSAQKLLTVIFTKSDCPECDNFYRHFLIDPNNEKLLKKTQVVQLNIKDKAYLIKPNGQKITANKWYEQLKLTDLPAMVFFDQHGNEIIRKDAFLKTFHFQSLLHYVVDKAYKKYPSFQRFIEHRSKTLREQGIDVNIWR